MMFSESGHIFKTENNNKNLKGGGFQISVGACHNLQCPRETVLLTKYHSGEVTKDTEMGRTCSTYGERINAYRVLVGKPEERMPLGRPRRRWEVNIKTDLEKWNGGMDWIHLAPDRDRWRAIMNAVMNLTVP